jgi:hypothetical protein
LKVIDLEREERNLRRSKLQCGIVRYVKNGNGWRYLNNVRLNLFWASDVEFESAITEMVAGGVLTKTIGRDGGLKLLLVNREATPHG